MASAKPAASALVAGSALALVASSVSAQNSPPVPPVDTPGTQVALAQMTYRAQCGESLPSIVLEDYPDVRLTFDTRGQFAVVTDCNDDSRIGVSGEVSEVGQALSFMAFREAEPFWEAAEAKWGNDLSLLRADLREAALNTTGETLYGRIIQGKTDVIRARAFDLSNLGYHDDAIALLDQEIERLFQSRLRRRSQYDFERVVSATARASIISQRDGDEAAAASLVTFLDRLPAGHRHTLNAKINLAAFWAEAGEYKKARDLLAPAYSDFRQSQGDSDRYKIGGSDREFSWILACAYHGMGDDSSAAPYRDVVNLAEENPRDEYLSAVKRSSLIRLRMAACMDDQPAYFETVFDGSFPPFSGLWSAVQSQRSSFGFHFRSDWTLPDSAKTRYLDDYRMLPESYSDALMRWENVPEPAD